jgi:hypothetical protein
MSSPVQLNLVCELVHTTLSNGAVATWTDQSGSGNDFTEATNRPTKDSTGVLFDGTNDVLKNTSLASLFTTLLTDYTVFVVAKPTSITGGRSLFSVGASGSAVPLINFRLSTTVDGALEVSKRSDSNESAEVVTADSAAVEAINTTRIFRHRVRGKMAYAAQ